MYCDNCPLGILRDAFREDVEAEFARLPGGRSSYGFDYLQECVINVLAAEGLTSDQMSFKTARMLSIVETERQRIKRVKQWNEKQEKDREQL